MPEPGIGDSDFDRPTTARKSLRRRTGKKIRLPVEYKEFRLEDGRFLGEVLGDGFFGAPSGADGGKPISNGDREKLREGNSALSRIKRDNPERFSPPETAVGISSRDGEALVPAAVEVTAPGRADPDVPTPPLPTAGGMKTRSVGGGRWQFTVPEDRQSSPLVPANASEPADPAVPETRDNPANRIKDAASLDDGDFEKLLTAIEAAPRLSRLQRTQLANIAHGVRRGELTGEDIPTALRMTGAWIRPPNLSDPSQPEDNAGETAWKLIENTPSMFKQVWGGLVMSRAESDGPMGRLEEDFLKKKLNSPNEVWRKLARKLLADREKERERNFAYGAELYVRATQDLMDNAPNVDPESLKGYGYDIGAAFVQMAPAVAATLASKGRTSAGMAVLGTQVYGQKYGEARASGRTEAEARQDATFYALSEAIPERIPLGILMKQGGEFLPRFARTMAAEGVQEIFTEMLQMGYETGVLDEEMTWGEAWDRIKRAGIVGSFVGGGTATATHPFVAGAPILEAATELNALDTGAALAPENTGDAAESSGTNSQNSKGSSKRIDPAEDYPRAGTRKFLRPLAEHLPDKWHARFDLAEFMDRAEYPLPGQTAEQYFASVWDHLDPQMKTFLDERFRNFAGEANERLLRDTLSEARFKLSEEMGERTFKVPTVNETDRTTKTEMRVEDEVVSGRMKKALLGLLAVPGRSDGRTAIEMKLQSATRDAKQESNDKDLVKSEENDIVGVEVLRAPADRITPEHLADVIDVWLRQPKRRNRTQLGKYRRADVENLVEMLREQRGPDGKPLSVGAVLAITLSFVLPLVYPDTADVDEQDVPLDAEGR